MNTFKNIFASMVNLFTGNSPKTIVLHRNDEFLPKDNLARIFLKIK